MHPARLPERAFDCRVVPVLTVDDAERAGVLGQLLADAGFSCVEVTLRTPAALDAIEAIARAAPHLSVSAGTITDGVQLQRAADAGAAFAFSAGADAALLHAAAQAPIALVPGVQTASEAMAALRAGFTLLKFFPAQAAGGIAWLRGIAAPFPMLRFVPTGGIGPDTAPTYLAQSNVAAVGGSWFVPAEAVASADWDRLATLARDAAALARA